MTVYLGAVIELGAIQPDTNLRHKYRGGHQMKFIDHEDSTQRLWL